MAATTETLTVPVMDPLVALRVVLPGARPVTTPCDTDAMLASATDQVSVWLTGLPDASFACAAKVAVWPATIVPPSGVMTICVTRAPPPPGCVGRSPPPPQDMTTMANRESPARRAEALQRPARIRHHIC